MHRPSGFHGAQCQPFLPRPGSQRRSPAQELPAAATAAANHERLCCQRNVLSLEKSQIRPLPPTPDAARDPRVIHASAPSVENVLRAWQPTRAVGLLACFLSPQKEQEDGEPDPRRGAGSRHRAEKKHAFGTTFLLLFFWPGIAGLQNSLHSCQPCTSRSLIPFFEKRTRTRAVPPQRRRGPRTFCRFWKCGRGEVGVVRMEGEMVPSSKSVGVGIPCFPLPPQGHTGAHWRSADHMGTCGRAKCPLR